MFTINIYIKHNKMHVYLIISDDCDYLLDNLFTLVMPS